MNRELNRVFLVLYITAQSLELEVHGSISCLDKKNIFKYKLL